MKIIKTILIGCAWCRKLIGIDHCETEDEDDYASISHGICEDCSDQVLDDLDEKE